MELYDKEVVIRDCFVLMTATQTNLTWVTGDTPRLITPNVGGSPKNYDFTLWFDGGCRSNPKGAAGSGAICRDTDSGEHLFEGYQSLTGTNNFAEWFGIYLGLRELVMYCERKIIPLERIYMRIRGDSNLVIQQLLGNWKIRDEKFRECYNDSRAILKKLLGWDAEHVYRDMNGEADALANKAMDGQ